jgi:phosphoribosylformylglycinamidine cyclo-ligase
VSDDALRYGSAGVDLDASNAAKSRIKKLVESTFTPGVLGGFGGFGGMFRVPANLEKPILVSSADGVGTKIKVAIEANRHDTIGRDLVNHCVNDILVQGALPLFFLDYVAFGKLDPVVVEALVAGIVAGCRENGCALIGGETAEMPGLYVPPDYDLAGFIVGYVEENRILGPHRVRPDDVLVGLPSSGLHTNGYSLARKIVKDRLKLGPDDAFPGGGGAVRDVLLAEHRSYLAALKPVLGRVHAMAHITGQLESTRCFSRTAESGIGRIRRDVPNVQHGCRNGGHLRARRRQRGIVGGFRSRSRGLETRLAQARIRGSHTLLRT